MSSHDYRSARGWSALLLFAVVACGGDDTGGGDDDGSTVAQQRGVGSACDVDTDCTEAGQKCLAFKGGYCGLEGCNATSDCPSGSACVAHTDGKNYCFLVCSDKPDCNVNRPLEVEANCSSTADFIDDEAAGKKACVPPSST